jgi:hypothetical protein
MGFSFMENITLGNIFNSDNNQPLELITERGGGRNPASESKNT